MALSTITKCRSIAVNFKSHAKLTWCWQSHQNRFATATTRNAPSKPKKPVTGYLQYRNKVLDDMRAKNKGLDYPAVIKVISEQYRSLDKEKLEALSKEYKKKLEQYKTDMKAWEENEPLESLSLKKLEKRLGKPNHPGGVNIKFYKDLFLNKPGMDISEAAQAWNNLPKSKKELYEKEYQQEMNDYSIRLEEWEDGLSDEAKQCLANAKEARKQARSKKSEHMEKPKRSPPSIGLFVKDYMSKHGCQMPEAINEWKKLSPAKKMVFEEEAKKLKEERERVLYEWEMKMIKAKKLAGVRKSTLRAYKHFL